MKDIITSPDLTHDANPRAASTRLKSKSLSKARGQRRHDFRLGPQPKYVDVSRSHLNRVLVLPRPIIEIRDEVVALREKGGAKRAMKSNAAIISPGIITFGREAAEMFNTLDDHKQDDAFLELAQSVAERLGTRLESLVVHLDETTIHAHYELRGYSDAGKPLSKVLTPRVSSELQDITAGIMQRFCRSIERCNKKINRLAAGANYTETLNRSVKQLHRDLPCEVEAVENQLSELRSKVDALAATLVKDRERVAKLEAMKELNEKEKKRLVVYERRLKLRVKDLLAAEAALNDAEKEFERVQRLTQRQAAQARDTLVAAAVKELEQRGSRLRSDEAEVDVARKLVTDDLGAVDTVVGLMVAEDAVGSPKSIPMPVAPMLDQASPRVRNKLTEVLEKFWSTQDALALKEALLDRLVGQLRRWLQRDDLMNEAREEGQTLSREMDDGPGW